MTNPDPAPINRFSVLDNAYPESTLLAVRTKTGRTKLDGHYSPLDGDVEHIETEFPVRWLRRRSPAFRSIPLASGALWMEPCVLDFTFVGDETIHLYKGAIDVVDATGTVHALRAGDVAYFAAETATTWSVLEQSIELFTILG